MDFISQSWHSLTAGGKIYLFCQVIYLFCGLFFLYTQWQILKVLKLLKRHIINYGHNPVGRIDEPLKSLPDGNL